MDVSPYFQSPEKGDAGLSALARGVIGSEILRIAGEIRALKAKGLPVCNLTVGDFDPALPDPDGASRRHAHGARAGHTNYPPSDGVLPLREAVVRFYERELGLSYPVDSVLVAGGARPLLYGAYRTLVDPGDAASTRCRRGTTTTTRTCRALAASRWSSRLRPTSSRRPISSARTSPRRGSSSSTRR